MFGLMIKQIISSQERTNRTSHFILSSFLDVNFLSRQEIDASERMRVTKTILEVTNEKLEAELEETKQRLRSALSKPVAEVADSKTWKASVVTRSANTFPGGLRASNL